MNRFLKCVIAFALACLISASSLQAAVYYWSYAGLDGNINTASNWTSDIVPLPDPPTLPTAGDWMWVGTTNTLGQLTAVANIDANYTNNSTPAAFFYVGRGAGTNGTVNQTSGNLVLAGGLRGIGREGGTGLYEMTGGSIVMQGAGSDTPLLIGANETSNGTMNITNGSVSVVGRATIGGTGGVGTLTMAGNSVLNVSGLVMLGDNGTSNPTSKGTFNMSGGTATFGAMWIGSSPVTSTATITGNTTLLSFTGGWGALRVGQYAGDGPSSGEMILGNGTDTPTIKAPTGFLIGCAPKCVGKMTVNSGTFDLRGGATSAYGNEVILGYYAAHSEFNQNGGQTLNDKVAFLGDRAYGLPGDEQSSVSTLNLNGGLFQAAGLYSRTSDGSVANVTSNVNFNGATLQATASDPNFIHQNALTIFNANVMKNATTGLGAVIDTNGYNIGCKVGLKHDPTEGAPAVDGGLIKRGLGTLTLAGADNTYTGNTVVEAGLLNLAPGVDEAPLLTFTTTNEILVQSGAGVGSDETGATTAPVNANITLDAKSYVSVAVAAGVSLIPLKVEKVSAGAGTGPVIVKLSGVDSSTGISTFGGATLLSYTSHGTLPTYKPWVDGVGQSDFAVSDDGIGAVTSVIADKFGQRGWNGVGTTWNSATNWTTPVGENTIPGQFAVIPASSPDRAWFDSAISTPGAVELDTPVVLSSMLFSAGTAGYTITPTSGTQATNTVTLSSSSARDSQIQVLAGTHEVAADIKMAGGDPIITLVPSSQLTLSGVMSNLTAAPAALTISGGGKLVTSNASSTYTGAVSVTGSEWSTNYFTPALISLSSAKLTLPGESKTVNGGLATIGNTTVTVTTAGSTLTVPADNANNSLGSGTIYKVGDGTLAFSSSSAGTSTLGGNLHCNAGTLAVASTTGATLTIAGNLDLGESGADFAGPAGTSIGTMTLSGNVTLKPSGQTKVGGYWHNSQSASPRPQGFLNLNDTSTFETSNWLVMGFYSSQGYLNVGPSATLKAHSDLSLGYNWGDETAILGYGEVNTTGHVVKDGGGRFAIGDLGSFGVWNQNAGLTESSVSIQLGQSDGGAEYGGGTMNFNGGTFMAPGIATGSTTAGSEALTVNAINFDGGTLKASAANGDFIANTTGSTLTLNILAGGVVIDTNGYNDTITQLLKDSDSTGGGLKKLGAGTLTLTVSPEFDGDTIVNAGTLVVPALNTPTSSVQVATGAALTATSIKADSLVIGGGPFAASANTATVPEPGTFLLLVLAGLGGLLAWRRK